MKYNKGFAPIIILLITLGVLAVGGVAYFSGKNSAPKNEVTDNSNYYPSVQQNQNPPTTNSNPSPTLVFPPNGWYVYNHSDIPNLQTSMMLTKQKTYPTGYCEGTEGACFGEQINISVSTTTLTPEQYVAHITVYPILSTQKWNTLNGYKTFSMTYTTEVSSETDGLYLFAGRKVYQFSLYPSAEKNRNDFQQVVNYYAKNI